MGFVGSLASGIGSMVGGVFSSDKGAGYQAKGVDIAPGITNEQLDTSHQQTQNGLYQQQAFIHALNAQNGIGNQNSVFAQQQGLANQLQNQANGGGPNPAQAMLNQATGQNVAQQQALMASQRGSSANAGLIARQAGMQGAGIQQQAAGQAATMGAQQQIAAQQALQQQQYMMGGLANQQVGQQQGALDSFNQSTQNLYGIGQQALANQNQANVAMQSNMNSANSGVAQQNAASQGKIVGGVLNQAGGAIAGKAGGKSKAHGGLIEDDDDSDEDSDDDSVIGNFLMGMMPEAGAAPEAGMMMVNQGGTIPGKARSQGDSLKNDVVPIMASPGEIMLPRSITEAPDAGEKAKKFVEAILAKNKMRRR